MNPERPIFLLGTGRCGSSLIFDLLASHPDVGWFSNYTNRFPNHPQLALLSRVHDMPGLRSLRRSSFRYVPRPMEAYETLNALTEQTFTSPRLLTAGDVTQVVHDRFRHSVESNLRWQGKSRFLHKHTGFARSEYLSAIFPDALFVHIYRDGRAVANSMNQVHWWSGGLDSWWWGDLEPEYKREYEDSGSDSLVLAGVVWKTLMDFINQETRMLADSRVLNIRYDDLVRDPVARVNQILRFCELPPSAALDRWIDSIEISDMDRKWAQQLSAEQQERLTDSLSEHLIRYGFEI